MFLAIDRFPQVYGIMTNLPPSLRFSRLSLVNRFFQRRKLKAKSRAGFSLSYAERGLPAPSLHSPLANPECFS